MKTIINRFDLYRFERLVSKLVKPSDLPAVALIASCPEGLLFMAFCNGAMLSYTVPTHSDTDPFTLPWQTLKELAQKKHDTIQFDVNGKDVTLSWNDNGIPQRKIVESSDLGDKRFPQKAEKTVAYSFKLFDAMIEAAKCVDDNSVRYALGAICLRGANNQIISTDGRQALIQDDYEFSFDNDVLCPVSRIFTSKELRELSETVKLGVKDDWVYFNVGCVNFWLQKIEGKYPQLDQFTKNIDGHSWLNVEPTDAVFVSERLDSLPGKNNGDNPVYVGLDKFTIAVRGYDTTMQTATELRLEESSFSGANVVMCLNRKFLKNALGFGITRLGFDPKDTTPIIGYGDKKTFIIMPLEGKEPEINPGKLTVLVSSAKTPKAVKANKPTPATQVSRNTKPQAKAKPKSKVSVLDDAMKLRLSLRTTLGDVNSLIQSIKSQRRYDKLLRDTVNSLRKLQNV